MTEHINERIARLCREFGEESQGVYWFDCYDDSGQPWVLAHRTEDADMVPNVHAVTLADSGRVYCISAYYHAPGHLSGGMALVDVVDLLGRIERVYMERRAESLGRDLIEHDETVEALP